MAGGAILLDLAALEPHETPTVEPVPEQQVFFAEGEDTNSTTAAEKTMRLAPQANIRLAHDNGVPPVIAGNSTSYTITVLNMGPSDAPRTVIEDIFPEVLRNLQLVSVKPVAGATTKLAPGAFSGSLSDIVDLPVGSLIVYVVRGDIDSSAFGTLANTVTVAVSAGVTNTGESSDTESDRLIHDAITPVPRAGDWLIRHEAINARVRQGNVDLVFIGDSITQGWEGSGNAVWQESYGVRNAVNLGINGDRTQHVIWRLDHGNLDNISPKLAVVMIGTNNSGTNTPDQIADGVAVIVNQIKMKTPTTKILLMAIFPRGATPQDPLRQVNERANAIASQLADDEHVFYMDIGENFLEDDGTLTAEIMPDFLHLSELGYAIWAESIESRVAVLMGEE